jgi:hypothetical protein
MEYVIVAAVLYFLPAVIAWCRGHHNRGAIFALNLLLGWTFVGWVAALVWSLTAVQAQANVKAEPRGLINVLHPKPKPPAPKPFLAANWDKPKPVPLKASSHPVDIIMVAVGLGALLFIGGIIIAVNHNAITAWLKPDAAPGIQYTGSVAEGLTPNQVKKLEAQRDTIPVVQTTTPVVQSVPLPPKKLKSKGKTILPSAVQ